jgi:hypothetical protein
MCTTLAGGRHRGFGCYDGFPTDETPDVASVWHRPGVGPCSRPDRSSWSIRALHSYVCNMSRHESATRRQPSASQRCGSVPAVVGFSSAGVSSRDRRRPSLGSRKGFGSPGPLTDLSRPDPRAVLSTRPDYAVARFTSVRGRTVSERTAAAFTRVERSYRPSAGPHNNWSFGETAGSSLPMVL